jgi:hypothetical protein
MDAIRKALRTLGAPPQCIKFTGCSRQLYTAASQLKIRLKVRRQQDGSYLVWRVPRTESLCEQD